MQYLIVIFVVLCLSARYVEGDGEKADDCKVNLSDSEKEIDIQNLLGLWRGKAYFDGSESHRYKEINWKFKKTNNGTLKLVEYTFDDAMPTPCSKKTAKVQLHEEGRMTIKFDTGPELNAWIVHVSTNYEYAFVFTCSKVEDDGDCQKSNKVFLWFSTHRKVTMKEFVRFLQGTNRTCIKIKDIKFFKPNRKCNRKWLL